MADYAAYVYPAYATALVVLALMLVHALLQRRARRDELAALESRRSAPPERKGSR